MRQRTSDLNLPLITALFNDSSLQLSDRFMIDPPSKSRSMQHLTPPTTSTPSNHHHHHNRHHRQHYYSNGNCSSGGCTSSSSSESTSESSTPSSSRASPASIERSCTFRVDEALAKSALRQSSNRNDANNNHHIDDDDHFHIGHRPISWHLEKSNAFINNGWPHQYNGYGGNGSSPNHPHQQQPQQPRRLSMGNNNNANANSGGGRITKMIIKQQQQPNLSTNNQFYQLRS